MFLKTNTQENALTLRPYSFLELNCLLLYYHGFYFLLLFFFFLTGIHESFWKRGLQDLKILLTDIVNNNFFTLQLPLILICVETKELHFLSLLTYLRDTENYLRF